MLIVSFPLYAKLPPGAKIVGSTIENIGPHTYRLLEYQSKNPPQLILDSKVQIKSCLIFGLKCKGGNISLEIGAFRKKDFQLRLEYLHQGKRHRLVINALPADFPFPKMEGKSAIKLPLIFAASSAELKTEAGCHLIILSALGKLQFYRRLPNLCSDFRPHIVEGKTFYSYQLIRKGISLVGTTGPRVILNENFRHLKSIAHNNDGHEFHLYSLDHWLGIENQLNRLKNGRPFLDKRIRERKNGKIVFEWGVSDYLNQFNSEATSSIALTNWDGEVVAEVLHINSIQRVGQDDLLIGLGYDGLGLLNRKSRKLKWVLGGLNDMFGLSMLQHPLFNHQPQYFPTTNELYVLSNRSYGPADLSRARAIRYQIDPKLKKVNSFEIIEESQFSLFMGSIQFIEGVLSVGYGEKFTSEYDFIELTKKKINWKIDLGGKLKVYRFYRAPFGELI